jgi:hypothetical protein
MSVMDNFVVNVEIFSVFPEKPFNREHGVFDSGAKASRISQKNNFFFFA